VGDLEFTLEDMQRLETRICELEAELDSVTRRKDEREHAVRQYETWLREARRERDEARAERDALREALKYEVQEHSCGRIASCSSCLLLRDTTPKTEEGGK
jgi:chromosome segregation ATPase